MSTTEIISAISNLAIVTFGNIVDDTIIFSCMGSMLQTNHAIHLGRDPSLLLFGATLCGQVMAALAFCSQLQQATILNHSLLHD
jgi:hypothetical protein